MSTTGQVISVVLLSLLLLPSALSSLSSLSQKRSIGAEVRGYVNDGLAAMEAKDSELAEVAFRAALSLDPTEAVARRGLDTIQAMKVTRMTTSVSRNEVISLKYRFEKAVKSDPVNAELYQLALGTLSVALNDKTSAQSWYEKATTPKNASSKAWGARGRFDLSRGELDDASSALKKALQIDKENAAARLSYGIVLKEQKKFDAAVSELETASKAIRSPKAYYELGDTHLRAGKFEPAYSAFQLALKSHAEPAKEPALLRRLGVTSFRLKKPKEAIAYFSAAAKVDNDPQVRLDLGAAYQSVGDHGAAIQQLVQVVKVAPLNAQARLALIGSLAQTQQIDQARRVGQDFLTLAKNEPKLKSGAEMITRALSQLEAPVPVPKPEVTVEEAMEIRKKSDAASKSRAK